MRRWRLIGLVTAALLQVLLWRAALPGRLVVGDEGMYLAAADRIRAGGNSEIPELWQPAYSWFLAGVRSLSEHPAMLAGAQLALLIGAAVLFCRALIAFGVSPALSRISSACLLLDPGTAAFAFYAWPEVLHLFLLAALLFCLARGGSCWSAALSGALAALVVVTKNVLLPLLPALFFAVWLRRREPLAPRRWLSPRWAEQCAAALGLVAVLAPALYASHRQHGAPTLGGSALFNLWVGLQPTASWQENPAPGEYRDWRRSADTVAERSRVLRRKLVGFLRTHSLLELARQQLARQHRRLFSRDSFLNTQLPGGLAHQRGLGYRAVEPLVAAALRIWHDLAYALLLLLWPIGAAVALCRRARWARWVWVFLGYQLLLFLVVHVVARYRVAMFPALALFAVSALVEARAVDWRRPAHRGALAAGAAVAVLLLCLAFA